MQTHEDKSHRLERELFMELLTKRAEKAVEDRTSEITTGKPDEEPLARWKASNGVHVIHMPDDPQYILRISLGGGDNVPVTMNYCTIRGGVGQCIDLLEKAIVALKECPE